MNLHVYKFINQNKNPSKKIAIRKLAHFVKHENSFNSGGLVDWNFSDKSRNILKNELKEEYD